MYGHYREKLHVDHNRGWTVNNRLFRNFLRVLSDLQERADMFGIYILPRQKTKDLLRIDGYQVLCLQIVPVLILRNYIEWYIGFTLKNLIFPYERSICLCLVLIKQHRQSISVFWPWCYSIRVVHFSRNVHPLSHIAWSIEIKNIFVKTILFKTIFLTVPILRQYYKRFWGFLWGFSV